MKKSTIIRSILFAIIIVNMVLKYTGHDVLDIDETEIGEFVECALSVAILILSYWKNNSWTKNAQKADEYLEKLRQIEEEDE